MHGFPPGGFTMLQIPDISGASLPINHTMQAHSLPYTPLTLLDASVCMMQCSLITPSLHPFLGPPISPFHLLQIYLFIPTFPPSLFSPHDQTHLAPLLSVLSGTLHLFLHTFRPFIYCLLRPSTSHHTHNCSPVFHFQCIHYLP